MRDIFSEAKIGLEAEFIHQYLLALQHPAVVVVIENERNSEFF